MARKRWPLRDQFRHLAIEEGQQQRRDMGAVDIGVGHDDDALVAQIVVAIFRARAAAQRLHQIGQFLVLLQLAGRGAGHVQDLAAQGQDGLGGAVARLLGAAAGAVAFDQENLGAVRPRRACSRPACRAGAACASPTCARFPFPACASSRSSA